jgi:hypothetical protein
MTVTEQDLYAIKCALEGKGWGEVKLSLWLARTLSNLTAAGPTGVRAFQNALPYLIGESGVLALFQVDTEKPPPAPARKESRAPQMPPLLVEAELLPAQVGEAERAGRWLTEYVEWAGARANETPLAFHEAAGLALAGTAIGRRLYVPSHWGEEVHPNLYVMIIGISTYYHKTTALRLAQRMLARTMPHMLLPEPGSPENLISQLSGDESLMESMKPADKDKYTRGIINFAGQRLIVRDELSGLFKSMGKDYMAGMKERLMSLYDGADEIPIASNSRGIVIVHDAALNLIGTTTPAGLACAITGADWRDGNLARFALISPEHDFKDRPAPDGRAQYPADLEKRLEGLHRNLPLPPGKSVDGGATKMQRWAVPLRNYKQFGAYSNAMRQLTRPDSGLDDRLRPLYGRHPVKALKIALILAALDWEGNSHSELVIEPWHWWRAQLIAERWRASAHETLALLSQSPYHEAEAKIRSVLNGSPEGAAKTDFLRRTDLNTKTLDEVLSALVEAGEIAADTRKTKGRDAKIYRWA